MPAARGPIARAFPSWAGQGWRPYALLGLLCLGLYLPGMNALPVTDRDEARFAQATRQMIESGDYLRIRFQDEARNRKPAGIYWLQALSVATLSGAEQSAIWPYRLPSLLGAVAAVFLTFALGRYLVGYPAAFLGAALLAGSLTLVAEAHLAKTDAVLLGLVSAAQLALGRIYCQARGRGKNPRALALGAAVLGGAGRRDLDQGAGGAAHGAADGVVPRRGRSRRALAFRLAAVLGRGAVPGDGRAVAFPHLARDRRRVSFAIARP